MQCLFMELEELILKLKSWSIWPQIAGTLLKNIMAEQLTLSDVKTYLEATAIKAVWCECKVTKISEQDRDRCRCKNMVVTLQISNEIMNY